MGALKSKRGVTPELAAARLGRCAFVLLWCRRGSCSHNAAAGRHFTFSSILRRRLSLVLLRTLRARARDMTQRHARIGQFGLPFPSHGGHPDFPHYESDLNQRDEAKFTFAFMVPSTEATTRMNKF